MTTESLEVMNLTLQQKIARKDELDNLILPLVKERKQLIIEINLDRNKFRETLKSTSTRARKIKLEENDNATS